MPYQYHRHTNSDTPNENDGLLRRLIRSITPAWEKVKNYGKALVGGTIYYYGNRIFWGGETSRYLYKRYRTIFQRMGFVRQAILAYKHRIVAEKPKILSVNKQVMTLLEHRFKQIGVWEHYGWIAQDLLEFGDSFTEIVFSKPGYRVIGLKRLEPDYMYIQRDPYGRPLLYVSVIDGIPVAIEPYRILHVKMDEQPGDAFGVGLIEGGMDDLAALRILEDLNIQLVKHNIYPHRVYICPSDEIVAQIETKLGQQARFGDLVVPDGVKVQQMNSGTGIDLRGFMLYYQQKFFLDVGVPMDMLIKGTGGNRSTAAEMSSAFNGNARAIQQGILNKLEWLGELVLALEGISAPVKLVAPEIDKSLQFARRKEYRELYMEGLICRDFAQELLELKHPLNVIKVPENFMTQLNKEKNWMEQFKLGLLTRPYAIKLLGHDVPENRPAQPQQPNFMMPPPTAGGGGGAPPTGSPPTMGDEPDMLDPSQAQIIDGGEAQPPSDAPEGSAATGNPADSPTASPETEQQAASKTIRIGLKSINVDKLEGTRMAKDGYVQTVYIRKVGTDGKIEETPYIPVDVSLHRNRAHVEPNAKWQKTNDSLGKDCTMKTKPGKKGEVLNPEQVKKAPAAIDGDVGGVRTNPVPQPVDGTPLSENYEGHNPPPRKHRNAALPPGHERGNRPMGDSDKPLKRHVEPYGNPEKPSTPPVPPVPGEPDYKQRGAELREKLAAEGKTPEEELARLLSELNDNQRRVAVSSKNKKGKSLKDGELEEQDLQEMPEGQDEELEEYEEEQEIDEDEDGDEDGEEAMPPQGQPQQQQPPQGQAMPAGQPAMPPVIPGYFKPNKASDTYNPHFADVFGDNEYSIKNPQRHVERIREEMIDAYGQRHKRIHERTREHHRPEAAGQESDFIKRKKASANRRWMKKSPTKLKQSKNNEEYFLASIDVNLQGEGKEWISGLEHTVALVIDTVQTRVLSGLKEIMEKTVEPQQQLAAARQLITAELLVGNEKLQSFARKGMENLYSVGLHFGQDVFAYYEDLGTQANINLKINTNIKMLEDRFIVKVAEQLSKLVDSVPNTSLTQIVSAIPPIFVAARTNCATLALSAGYELFRTAFASVLSQPQVVEDVTAVEFLVPRGLKACKTCEAHNFKVMSPKKFEFENCHSCETVYRFHFVDEE
jgi:hypothetical protein